MISSDRNLGYWSHDTSYYYSHHRNGDDISDNESLEVSAGDVRRGHRYIETSHSSSHNRGVYHSSDGVRGISRSQDTRHYFSCNSGVLNFGVDGTGGTRSQDTSHSLSINCGAMVDVDGIGGYRSHTSHFSSHNPGVRGRLLSLSVSSCTVEKYSC